MCTGPLPDAPVEEVDGVTIDGTAVLVHGGSRHGRVCQGTQEGVDEALVEEVIVGGGCADVRVRQLRNSDGVAVFKLSVSSATVDINTVAMLIGFSNPPTSPPTMVGF
jgi:hypothetical protein